MRSHPASHRYVERLKRDSHAYKQPWIVQRAYFTLIYHRQQTEVRGPHDARAMLERSLREVIFGRSYCDNTAVPRLAATLAVHITSLTIKAAMDRTESPLPR